MREQAQALKLLITLAALGWSAQSPSAILLQQADGTNRLVVEVAGRVLNQECGTLRPNLRDGEKAQQACQAHSQKKPQDVSIEEYEMNFNALNGVPTEPGEKNPLGRAALADERALRNPEEQDPNQPSQLSGFERVLRAYGNWMEYLATGEKILPKEDPLAQDAVLAAFAPVFSDGEHVVRLSAPVDSGKFATACPAFWTPMSIMAAANIRTRPQFGAWLLGQLPKGRNYVWSAHYYVGRYSISDSIAYQDDSALLILYIRDNFTSGTFPAPSVESWNKAPKDIAEIQGVIQEHKSGTYTMPVLCFRRTFPEDFRRVGTAPEMIDLKSLASRFKHTDPSRFRRIALQWPQVERFLGTTMLLDDPISPLSLTLVQENLMNIFQPALPRVEEVRKVIAQREKEAAAERQRQAELAAAERQAEYNRQQAERTRRANQFTVNGVTYDSNADYERRNPGWHWNEAKQRFVGPAYDPEPVRTTYSTRSSSSLFDDDDDDGWVTVYRSTPSTIRLSPSYSSRSSRSYSSRSYGSSRTITSGSTSLKWTITIK